MNVKLTFIIDFGILSVHNRSRT